MIVIKYCCNQGNEKFHSFTEFSCRFNFENIDAVKSIEIYNDDSEFDELKEKIVNLPMFRKDEEPKIVYYGDMAKFILANI